MLPSRKLSLVENGGLNELLHVLDNNPNPEVLEAALDAVSTFIDGSSVEVGDLEIWC